VVAAVGVGGGGRAGVGVVRIVRVGREAEPAGAGDRDRARGASRAVVGQRAARAGDLRGRGRLVDRDRLGRRLGVVVAVAAEGGLHGVGAGVLGRARQGGAAGVGAGVVGEADRRRADRVVAADRAVDRGVGGV